MEIINLRCIYENIENVIDQYLSKIVNLSEVKQAYEILVFRHSRLEMELAITIKDRNQENHKSKSDLGTRMADGLKKFGVVNHDIWLNCRL